MTVNDFDDYESECVPLPGEDLLLQIAFLDMPSNVQKQMKMGMSQKASQPQGLQFKKDKEEKRNSVDPQESLRKPIKAQPSEKSASTKKEEEKVVVESKEVLMQRENQLLIETLTNAF